MYDSLLTVYCQSSNQELTFTSFFLYFTGHGLTCYKCTYGTSGCSAVPFDGSASGVTTDYQYLGHTCDFCYTIHVPQDGEYWVVLICIYAQQKLFPCTTGLKALLDPFPLHEDSPNLTCL